MKNETAAELYSLIKSRPTLRLTPFVVTDTSPLLVTIDGGSSPIPARAIAGQTLTIGDTGFALYQPPLPPVLLETA